MPIEESLKEKILPLNFTFRFNIPFYDRVFEIKTDRENETLFHTIYAFIRLAVDAQKNIFELHSLPEVCHNIAQHIELTNEERDQYDFAGKAIAPINAYNRFLAMVIVRLSGDKIIESL
ncbi:MAG: hypothetical protein ACMG57_01330 [Candidatus Dojkabacteria bacterium]